MPKEFRPKRTPVPNAFRLLGRCLKLLGRHWKLFGGMLLVYGLLNLVLVHGLAASSNLSNLKTTLDQLFHGSTGKVSAGFTLFVYLLGSSGSSASPAAGVYEALLAVLVSLALIWSLRQIYARSAVRARDGFYRGMYPLVPFILVLLVIGLQLIPLLLGGSVYSLVVNNGIAATGLEKFVWLVIFILLAALSLYWLCSSIFALYIVTLPDMTPMKALRTARELVRYRRLMIVRKLLFLPLGLLVIGALILVPLIILFTPSAEWVYFGLSILGLAVVHSYMYALYRELL